MEAEPMRPIVLAILVSTLSAACGGSRNASQPSPVLTGVTITAPSTGALFLGETYTFSMSARLSDGTIVTTGGTWGSDAPSVATVNSSSGAAQIVGLGEATIYVDYQGQRGTHRIRSTVGYDGTLSAISRVTSCVDTGDWAAVDACEEFPNGFEADFTGTFTQSDRTVTAVMSLGGEYQADPAIGQVSDSGELRFETVHKDGDMTVTVGWTLRPSGVDQVSGSHALRFEFVGVAGYVDVAATILPGPITRIAAPGASGDRSYDAAMARASRRLPR
jgi:hypothetical protein